MGRCTGISSGFSPFKICPVKWSMSLLWRRWPPTRAGRERYEQLKKSARQVAQNPAVRNTAETAAQQGRQVAGKAYHAVS